MANPSIRFRKVQSYPTSGVNTGDVIFCVEDRTVYVATGSTTKEAFYGGNVKNVTTVEDSNGAVTGLQITYMDGTDPLTVDFFALKTELAALHTEVRTKVNDVVSNSGAIRVGGGNTASDGTVIITKSVGLQIDTTNPGNVTLSQSANGLKASVEISELPSYTIEELGTAETGYLKSYQLTKDGTAVGAKINIPKDLVVTRGSIVIGNWDSEGTTFTESTSGTGKALKLVIANQTDPIYINVKDLVDTYTAGDGITIGSDNKISIDANNAAAHILVPNPDLSKVDNEDIDLDTAIGLLSARTFGGKVTSINGKSGSLALAGYYDSQSDDAYKNVTFISKDTSTLGAYVAGLGTAATKSADYFASKEYVDEKHTWYTF